MRKLICLSAVAFLFAPVANAQPRFYLGSGVGYTYGNSIAPNQTYSNSGELAELGVTAGVRFDSGGAFYGAELDADIFLSGALVTYNGLSCADGFAAGAYFCSHSATVRSRGIVGFSLGPSEVFATAGYAVMFGQAAIPDGFLEYGSLFDAGSVGGLTFSIGLQRRLASGMLRFEIIQDTLRAPMDLPDDNFEPLWSATTVKKTISTPMVLRPI